MIGGVLCEQKGESSLLPQEISVNNSMFIYFSVSSPSTVSPEQRAAGKVDWKWQRSALEKRCRDQQVQRGA